MPKLSSVIGHTRQLEELRTDIASNNVAHAYLFSGPRHLGKMKVAHWFACQLLSGDCSKEENAQICKEVKRLTHPDLLVLDQLWIEGVCDDWNVIAKTSNVSQVHRSKKPAAKTDTISIDDVRALQERLYETGTGTWRCCIIRSAERMQDTAANAFLKILEEPPPGLVFLLTTQSRSSLLPTIVSRTRVVRFQRLSRKDLAPLLEDVSEDDATFLRHLAQGAPGIIQQLRDDPDILRQRRLLHEKADSFWKTRSLRERLQVLEPLHERGQEAEEFLLHLTLTLREQHTVLSPERVQALIELARGLKTNAQRQLLVQRFALELDER